jgi:hypothetical protein
LNIDIVLVHAREYFTVMNYFTCVQHLTCGFPLYPDYLIHVMIIRFHIVGFAILLDLSLSSKAVSRYSSCHKVVRPSV